MNMDNTQYQIAMYGNMILCLVVENAYLKPIFLLLAVIYLLMFIGTKD